MNTVLLFSGQGSQYVGMLKDIYDSNADAKRQIEYADDLLGYKLSSVCFEGPEQKLKETRYTQPAICLHSCALFDLIKNKVDFNAVAGHSVGEYAALYAAGVISFEDTMKLVNIRGKLMYEAGKKLPGTMFAIINLDDDVLINLCDKLTNESEGLYIVPANFNAPGQIVISGSAEYLRSNASKFKEAGARMVKELSVSGAFHSPLMEPAKSKLEKAILEVEFKDSNSPVYVNVSAEPLTNAADIRKALIAQLNSPVMWTQTLLNLKSNDFNRFIEIGPGNVIQGLVKRTLSDVVLDGLDKYSDVANYF